MAKREALQIKWQKGKSQSKKGCCFLLLHFSNMLSSQQPTNNEEAVTEYVSSLYDYEQFEDDEQFDIDSVLLCAKVHEQYTSQIGY